MELDFNNEFKLKSFSNRSLIELFLCERGDIEPDITVSNRANINIFTPKHLYHNYDEFIYDIANSENLTNAYLFHLEKTKKYCSSFIEASEKYNGMEEFIKTTFERAKQSDVWWEQINKICYDLISSMIMSRTLQVLITCKNTSDLEKLNYNGLVNTFISTGKYQFNEETKQGRVMVIQDNTSFNADIDINDEWISICYISINVENIYSIMRFTGDSYKNYIKIFNDLVQEMLDYERQSKK